MTDRKALLQEAHARWKPGTGPWSKDEPLDQVDLVKFEELSAAFHVYSDTHGLLAGCIQRLVNEIRRAKGLPFPGPGPLVVFLEENAPKEKEETDGLDHG